MNTRALFSIINLIVLVPIMNAPINAVEQSSAASKQEMPDTAYEGAQGPAPAPWLEGLDLDWSEDEESRISSIPQIEENAVAYEAGGSAQVPQLVSPDKHPIVVHGLANAMYPSTEQYSSVTINFGQDGSYVRTHNKIDIHITEAGSYVVTGLNPGNTLKVHILNAKGHRYPPAYDGPYVTTLGNGQSVELLKGDYFFIQTEKDIDKFQSSLTLTKLGQDGFEFFSGIELI